MVAIRKIEAAIRAAEWLESNRQHVHANAVRSVCRSNSALIETCRQLTEERERLRVPEECLACVSYGVCPRGVECARARRLAVEAA